MQKKEKRQKDGYFEISKVSQFRENLPLTALAGNVIYNGLHWHNHAELFLCLYGEVAVRVEGEVYRLTDGDFILINGGESHEIFDGIRDGLQIICSIEPSLFRNEQEDFICQTVGEDTLDKSGEDAKEIQKLLCELAYLQTPDISREQIKENSAYWKKRQRELPEEDFIWEYRTIYENILKSDEEWYTFYMDIYGLLRILSKHKRIEEKEEKNRQEELEKCVSYIHKHYQEELTVGRLAKEVNVSEPSLFRIFQNGLSLTPITYIHIYRVHMACALLQKQEKKVADIAFECGFTSLSNFYRTFEKHMKVSPCQYRKKMGDISMPESFSYQSILDTNIFQNFFELPYTKEVFLNY